jgi:MFS transporter, DHA2 family, glioxin efflux transporter
MSLPLPEHAANLEGSELPKNAATSATLVDNDGERDGTMQEKPKDVMTEDLYPHGIHFVFLAGASIIAVFLIALDQVSLGPLLLILQTCC